MVDVVVKALGSFKCIALDFSFGGALMAALSGETMMVGCSIFYFPFGLIGGSDRLNQR